MRRLLVLLILGVAGASGCVAAPASSAIKGPLLTPAMSDSAGRAMVRTELLFGLTRGTDGEPIDQSDWDKFVEDSIAVWFPGGFTVADTTGRWRGADGKIVAERSRVLIIYHDGSEQTLRKLDDLRKLYSQRFGQQSVIRASTNAWVAF